MTFIDLRQGFYKWSVSRSDPKEIASPNFYPGGFGTGWKILVERLENDVLLGISVTSKEGVCATFYLSVNGKCVLSGCSSGKRMAAQINSKEFYRNGDSGLKSRADIEVQWDISEDVGKETARETLAKDLGKMLSDAKYSDFAIEGRDGTRFPVHRNVLSARCPVFRTMLDTEMAKAKTGCLKIDDFPSKTVKDLIAFLYTGRLPKFDHSTYVELFKAGQKYELADLIGITAEQLILHLSTTTAVDVLLLGDVYEEKCLRSRSLEYIAGNRSSFKDFKELDVLLERKPKLLKDIIKALALP